MTRGSFFTAKHIHCWEICGVVSTRSSASAEQHRKIIDESRVLDILRQTPASRVGNADEVIGAALFLGSAKVGSFVAGP